MPNSDHWEKYLDEIYREYQSSANPLLLLDALKVSWWGKLPLPVWAHVNLGCAAGRYLRGDGNSTFDELLGLKASRGRDKHPLKQRRNKEVAAQVSFRVVEANKRYKFTLPVVYWLLSKTGIDGQYLSCDRIRDIYKAGEKVTVFEEKDSGFISCGEYGYFDAIFNNEKELRELGLYDSAVRTINKMLKMGGK